MTEPLSFSLFSAFLELIFWMTGGWKGARWQVTEVSFWYSPLNQLKPGPTPQILKLWDVNMLCCLCRCTEQRVPPGHVLKDKIQVWWCLWFSVQVKWDPSGRSCGRGGIYVNGLKTRQRFQIKPLEIQENIDLNERQSPVNWVRTPRMAGLYSS